MPALPRLSRVRLLTLAAAAAGLASLPLLAQPAAQGEPRALLDETQINQIRQAELQPKDAQNREPRIRFENRLIQRFVDARTDLTFQAFNDAGDVEKALYILENGNAEERADVQIVTDPLTLDLFKRTLHTAVMRGCATSACHGSDDAEMNAGFRLYNTGRTDDVIYTNFYTLSKTRVGVPNPTGGAFGGPETVERRMIERQDPSKSLLLAFALPADATDRPHPEVEGFRPLFQTSRDPVFLDMLTWLNDVIDRSVDGYAFDSEADSETPAVE